MAGAEPHIGVDFDNTIVCYDELFHRAASGEGLIPKTLSPDKNAVRDYLRATGCEDRWTLLQGLVYGERMEEARPFPGVRDFFLACRERGVRVSIISHRTRQPIAGGPCDLHAAAFRWLELNGFLEVLSREAIWFEERREGKVARAVDARCTHFIDDLPEFLAEPLLPGAMQRILFDPWRSAGPHVRLRIAHSWAEVCSVLKI